MAIIEIRCSGILFDLDGTLIDSGSAVQEAWTKFALQVGRDPAEILAMCHGVRTIEVIEQLGLDTPARDTAVAVEAHIVDAGSQPTPGAIELLQSLPPKAWAVVTSSLTETAWSRFDRTQLPAPEHIVSADDVVNGKPDPEGYVKGAEILNVPPAACLVIEDAVAGVGAANAAGMRSLAVLTTEAPENLSTATYIVKDLSYLTLASAEEATDGSWHLVLHADVA